MLVSYYAFASNAKSFAIVCVLLLLLLLVTLSAVSGISGNSGQKIILQTKKSEYNSVICSYKGEIFRVYSFSEQVVAKGNSLEAT